MPLDNAVPKPLPQAVHKRSKIRRYDADDEKARKEIRALDKHKCRVCGRKTNVVHEEKRRGAGGQVSPENSYLACDLDTGGVCHPILQRRHAYAVMANGSDQFNAREELIFEMSPKVAEQIFERRPIPAHVRITEE